MLVTAPLDPGWETQATPVWASLDAFLADIGPRAFRFAEAGLRHHDDAMDAVQDAMMKMLVYRERPATEWTPLFWSILRRKIVDLQRRGNFRLRQLAPASERSEHSLIDWADTAAGPSQAHDQREAYAKLVVVFRNFPAHLREAFTLLVRGQLAHAGPPRSFGRSDAALTTPPTRPRAAMRQQLEKLP